MAASKKKAAKKSAPKVPGPVRVISKVTPNKTYYGTKNTKLTAPGFGLRRADTNQRWRIVDEKTGKNVAILSLAKRPGKGAKGSKSGKAGGGG